MSALQQFKIENLKFKILGRGFTLIEILIAITIISIISSIGFVAYGQTQVLARDGKRKADLRAIATALELYRIQNNNLYPRSYNSVVPLTGCVGYGNFWCLSNSTNTPWIPGLSSTYMSPLPKDPKSNGGDPIFSTTLGYGYYSNTNEDQTGLIGCGSPALTQPYFILVAQLENTSDPDRNEVKQYLYCGDNTRNPADTPTSITDAWSGSLFAVSSD